MSSSEFPAGLQQALAEGAARQDKVALVLVACIELSILLASFATSTADAFAVAATVCVVSLELATLAVLVARPQQYVARWRLPLITVVRLTNMVLYPRAIDLLSIMAGTPAADAAGSGTAAGPLARAAALLRAASMLAVPVAGVHACMLAALYWQLPPAAHLVVHVASVGGLVQRAPQVCQQYVSLHPANRQLAQAAHWLVRNAVATVLLGTREHLEAAATEASPVEQCTAVAWTLEASFGLVLPTLLVWRQQLQAARNFAQRQRLQLQLHAASSGGGGASASLEAELASNAYARLCQPVWEAVDSCGGWGLPVALAAVAGFVAATLARPGAAG